MEITHTKIFEASFKQIWIKNIHTGVLRFTVLEFAGNTRNRVKKISVTSQAEPAILLTRKRECRFTCDKETTTAYM